MAKHAAPQSNGAAVLVQRGVAAFRTPGARVVVAAAAAVLVLGLALWLWLGSSALADGLAPDVNAQQGTLHASSVEVPEGAFQLVLNQTPTATAGSGTLNVEFENPAANAYAGYLTLRLEDNTVLGSTGVVEPGSYVTHMEMKRRLNAGTYPARAEVVLLEDGQEVGRSSAAVEVRVIAA